MEILLSIFIFILGLCCGSFVNMLVYRVAVNYKLKNPPLPRLRKGEKRSFCDYCGRQLSWYENIPVVSWILQKGKTRCCGKKLPVLYSIVETATGLLFLIYESRFMIYESNIFIYLVGLVVIVFLVFSGVFDLKYMILPDFSTGILIISALFWLIVGAIHESPLHLLSAVGSFLFLYFLYLVTKKKGMGFGDVKLAIFMGLFLGYPKIIVAFYMAFVVGAVLGLFLLIFNKKVNKKTPIPFGPFLILGTLVAWFWGEQIINLSVFQFVK